MLGTEDAGPVCSLDVSDSGLTQLKLRGAVGATDSRQSDRRREDRRREDRRREDEPVGAQVSVHGFTLLSRTKPELAGFPISTPSLPQDATPAALSCQVSGFDG